MTHLSIDIETYSSTDLSDCGTYRYVEDPAFEVLLLAFAFDDDEVEVIDLTKDPLPAYLAKALTDATIRKHAFNANFEITCLSAMLGTKLPAEQWECTMVRAAMAGLPFSLEKVAEVLRLEEQKDRTGKVLINYFSVPCKPTKSNGMRTRNLPRHDADKWELFKRYCAQDVRTERAILRKLRNYPISESEHALWVLDQQINGRGIKIDRAMAQACVKIDDENKSQLLAEAQALTGLDNPNSLAQLKPWVEARLGYILDRLTKTIVKDLLNDRETPEEVKKALQLRLELAKTSLNKYRTMLDVANEDDRARGLFQFYGANRTGRWAGRKVQFQNLPQNHLQNLDLDRETVKQGDLQLLNMLYDNPSQVMSELIRTCFIAEEGKTFIVADFSAIEARVLSWLAGEKWRLDVFNSHGKIYEATAALMHHCTVEEITKTDIRRQKGKIAELACGYQGSVGAFKAFGGDKLGFTDDELLGIVKSWRRNNPRIVQFWYDIENAFRNCSNGGGKVKLRGLELYPRGGAVHIRLHSGRELVYQGVRVQEGKISYMGVNQITRKWERIDTYGGKLTENVVQAISRDCLALSITRLSKKGYDIVAHIHDEGVIEHDREEALEEVCDIMGKPIPWAPGLPLRADGYATKYYKKD